MTEPAAKIAAAQQGADALDAALLDVLTRHLDVAARSGLDPAREARAMRQLAGGWRADAPPSVGLRVYGEVLGASLRKHSPVSLHVAASERDVSELARAHFGFSLPMTVHPTASTVVQALVDDRHAVGV